MKYDAVIFDFFGTLVDDLVYPERRGTAYRSMMADVAAALSVPYREFHRLWSSKSHERNVGLIPDLESDLARICDEAGIRASHEQTAAAARIRHEYIRSSLVPRKDALDTLARLRDSGCGVGLISNCASELPRLWTDTPFAALMDAVIFSCEVGLKKPDQRIFKMACERLHVQPERCLYVGDGGSDELTAASGLGMDAVLMRAPYDTAAGTRQEWLGLRVSSLAQVIDIASGG